MLSQYERPNNVLQSFGMAFGPCGVLGAMWMKKAEQDVWNVPLKGCGFSARCYRDMVESGKG